MLWYHSYISCTSFIILSSINSDSEFQTIVRGNWKPAGHVVRCQFFLAETLCKTCLEWTSGVKINLFLISSPLQRRVHGLVRHPRAELHHGHIGGGGGHVWRRRKRKWTKNNTWNATWTEEWMIGSGTGT